MRRFDVLVLLLVALPPSSCVTTSENTTDAAALPSWVPQELQRDAALDEAAAVLCARGTDAVIDDDVRAAAHVADGRVLGALGDSAADVGSRASALFAGAGLSHVGYVDDGRGCVAVVGSRRVVSVTTLPPLLSTTREPSLLSLSLSSRRTGEVYVLSPDGFVDRLPANGGGALQELKLPFRKEGRHVVEVIVDDVDADGNARGDPEVALLWPYVKGTLQLPPTPAVLFPDEGHDDLALSHRAEALVQRLRNEQLLDPLRISPPLTDTAVDRARSIGAPDSIRQLGHRVLGKSPKQQLEERFPGEPRAQFIRLAEVQARGSTLDDAWHALVDSPAHRYELVATGVTHMGVAVVRGQDSLGRTTITLVALLGRRPPQRDPQVWAQRVRDEANRLRLARGYDPVKAEAALDDAAGRLARAMLQAKKLDDTLLGGPVGSVALEADASMTKVYPFVARTDDPETLQRFAPLLDIDTSGIGAGLAYDDVDGVFYVVILAGVGGG